MIHVQRSTIVQNLSAIAIASLHVANLQAKPSNTVTVQCTVLVTVVVESNHKNALIRIARNYVIVPRACQISRSSTK